MAKKSSRLTPTHKGMWSTFDENLQANTKPNNTYLMKENRRGESLTKFSVEEFSSLLNFPSVDENHWLRVKQQKIKNLKTGFKNNRLIKKSVFLCYQKQISEKDKEQITNEIMLDILRSRKMKEHTEEEE